MPLDLGNTWAYQAKSGLTTRFTTIKITKRAAVGTIEGYALSSEIGDSTIAWRGNQLLVGRLANSEFFPPLPIYANSKVGDVINWKGTVRASGSAKTASGQLIIKKSTDEELDGKKISLAVGEVTLKIDNERHEITTWLQSGKGIYRQEHRINDTLATQLRYVSGP